MGGATNGEEYNAYNDSIATSNALNGGQSLAPNMEGQSNPQQSS